MTKDAIQALIATAETTHTLSEAELTALLADTDEENSEALFAAARRVRNAQFGDKIFLYSFVYFSTWCRNNCNFCYYRRDNRDTIHYRKSNDEIRRIASELAATGVQLVDLTMGEDPQYHEEGFTSLFTLIEQIIADTGLPVMVSPGVVGRDIIKGLAQAGATWYALYQETYNRELFQKLRIGQSFDERMAAKLYARECGMLIEEGLLTGAGESAGDVAQALLAMSALGAGQLRAMTFVPQSGTPMETLTPQGPQTELKVIALLRLLNPQVLIPASLDVEGADGLERRVNAGSNVITSIIPPTSGLAGVAQSTKDVSEGMRTVVGVLPRLQRLGLTAADSAEYQSWLAGAKAARGL